MVKKSISIEVSYLRLGENIQYGSEMTKPLPTGCMNEQKRVVKKLLITKLLILMIKLDIYSLSM